MSELTVKYYDSELDEEVTLPGVHEVCETCRGNGTHVNPSIDGNGLSQEDMTDIDFMEDYMSGAYDVRCTECHGKRVVVALDMDRCTQAQIDAYCAYQQELYDIAAEYAAERAMGA
jgi:LSD1 subclass zinc finger protein